MGIVRKYALVLALALAVIYAYAPLSLEDFAKPRWLDDIRVIVNKSLAPAKPEGRVSRVDPITPRRMSTRTWTIELPSG